MTAFKKMNGVLYLVLFLTLSLEALGQTDDARDITNVSVSEFKDLMDSLQGEVVVDLRTPDEIKQGRIAGAVVIDFFGADFEPSIQALDRKKVYLLYCASGGRSGETADLMAKWGFKKVYNLEQGFNGWAKQRMPVSLK